MRELLILRHGKSDWEAGTSDFARPLTNRGRRAAERVGSWLEQHGLEPDLVVSSPARRAASTAELVCYAMGRSAASVRLDGRIYAAPLVTLVEVVRSLPDDAGRVLLVGHNPGLEELIEWLARHGVGTPTDGKVLPTGALAQFRLAADWPGAVRGCGTLVELLRPRAMPSEFPVPTGKGIALRERPSYCYRQAGAVPYRLRGGKVEVLLVGRSGAVRRSVPRGIQHLDRTPESSARQHALEQAGVRGVIDRDLGTARVQKWGARCRVAMFRLRVDDELPPEAWAGGTECERLWLPAGEARGCVHPESLATVVRRAAAGTA
ncbi:MAG: histidine phosphatase family protein [Planctomycetes bacterium]|nr:histidine phosphatase family protein [Planctomycetota bacterium]